MISIQLRHKRQTSRQKDILRRNINRAITLKQDKFVFKLQSTNSHIYMRVYKVGSQDCLCTVSTIEFSKLDINKGKRRIQIIPQIIDEALNQLKLKINISNLDTNQIIWYLGGGKYLGRIKTVIDIFLHNLKNIQDQSNSDSEFSVSQDSK